MQQCSIKFIIEKQKKKQIEVFNNKQISPPIYKTKKKQKEKEESKTKIMHIKILLLIKPRILN